MILFELFKEIVAIVFIGLLIGAALHTIGQIAQLIEDMVVWVIGEFKRIGLKKSEKINL